jgi:tetratricopeptide (TPR) repeat protein
MKIIDAIEKASKYFTEYKYNKAIDYCDDAINTFKRYPQRYQLYNIKGNAHSAIDEFPEAVDCYDKAIELNPNSVDAYYNKGIACGNMKKIDKAIICYSKVIELDPNNTSVYLNKASAHSAIGQNEEAIFCYDQAIRLDGDNLEAYFNKALAHGALLQYDEAILSYDKIIEADGWLLVNAYYNKAIILSEMGRFDDAIWCCDKMIELDPDHIDAYGNKGAALLDLKRTQEAIECFDKVIELDPGNVIAYVRRGVAFKTIGQVDEAIKCYDQAIQIDTENVDAYYNKGVALLGINEYEEAIKCFDMVIKLKPDHFQAYINKAGAHSQLDNNEEAIRCYDKVIDLNPNYPEAYYNKGVIFQANCQYDDALHYFNKAIELDPRYINAYINKGNVLSDTGDVDNAIVYYDKALELDPCNLVWINKGVALAHKGHYENAFDCFDKALEIDPRDTDGLIQKGNTLRSLGNADEKVLECYNKALVVNPNDPLVYSNLALFYKSLHRYDEAMASILKAKSLVDTSQADYSGRRRCDIDLIKWAVDDILGSIKTIKEINSEIKQIDPSNVKLPEVMSQLDDLVVKSNENQDKLINSRKKQNHVNDEIINQKLQDLMTMVLELKKDNNELKEKNERLSNDMNNLNKKVKLKKDDYQAIFHSKLVSINPNDQDKMKYYYDGFLYVFTTTLPHSSSITSGTFTMTTNIGVTVAAQALALIPVIGGTLSGCTSIGDFFIKCGIKRRARTFINKYSANMEHIVTTALVDNIGNIKSQVTDIGQKINSPTTKLEALKKFFGSVDEKVYGAQYANLYFKYGVLDAQSVLDVTLTCKDEEKEADIDYEDRKDTLIEEIRGVLLKLYCERLNLNTVQKEPKKKEEGCKVCGGCLIF